MSTEPNRPAEALLNKEIQCLDHGFVRLVDYMGSDEAIVQAARVSYGKGTKRVREDRGLIRYLLRHRHTSPFEMVEFKFHCKMPIFVARQWIRHRTASVNEYSLRYSRAIDHFYIPEPDAINYQSSSNKQGRSDDSVPKELRERVLDILTKHAQESWTDYEEMESSNIARELARIHLPLSLYTEWYWKIDLANLLHFIHLRMDRHAQYEIRVFAEAIAGIVKEIVPVTWEAFLDYIAFATQFSRHETRLIMDLLNKLPDKPDWKQLAIDNGFNRFEAAEFADKMKAAGDNAS